MRIHHLSMTAWGPFAGTEQVDLDHVAAHGLFLLRGATGAGKTSILDAICFAIYAAVPGARQTGRALRSDHAPRDAHPSVELELTAAGRRLRIVRSPEYQRPKRRGEGETREPARVTLEERLDGAWRTLSTRHDEVADVVDDVIGMGLAQFSRVVLLPQGEFATFLRASQEQRRQLLERLFDVSTFTGVETWLADQRRRTADTVARARSEVATGLARLEDALARVPSERLDVADTPDAASAAPGSVLLWVEGVVTVLDGLAAEAMADHDRAALGAERARTRSVSAQRRAHARRKGEAARGRLVTLEAASDEIAAARDRLDRARRAVGVSGERSSAARAAVGLAAAIEQVRATRPDAADLAGSAPSVEDLRLLRDRIAAHDAALHRSGDRDVARGQRRRRRDEVSEGQVRAAAGLARARDELDEAQHRERASRAELEVARRAEVDVATARATVERCQRRVDARRRAEQLDAELAALKERTADLRQREQDARESLLSLREDRIAGMSGELAEGLAPGDACPVCGSTEHPRPASRTNPVSPEQVAQAEERLAAAQAEVTAARSQSAGVRAILETAVEDLGEGRGHADDAGSLESALAAAQRHLVAARRQADSATQAQAQLKRLEGEIAEGKRDVDRLSSQIAAARATLEEMAHMDEQDDAAIREAVSTHAADCPCAARSRADGVDGVVAEVDIEDLRGHHDRTAAAIGRHLEAVTALEAARAEHIATQRSLEAALLRHRFLTVEEAEAAELSEPALDALEHRIREHGDALVEARTILDDAEVREALGAPPPQVDAARDEADRAEAALASAIRSVSAVESALEAARTIHGDLRSAVGRLGPAIERAETINRMAGTVSGSDNALRMRLSSFVLAARLERVVDLANERLAVMADGRYRLMHSDDLAARGARSGLGLRVLDQWTGQTRDTATLSGGETFVASLALALGLAEAVREEAGGFDLQTLFVDEGFGSLDQESLEQVMTVLDGLRDGGRAVGVVSHVTDLQDRITHQVVVRKTPTGSTISVVAAEDPAA